MTRFESDMVGNESETEAAQVPAAVTIWIGTGSTGSEALRHIGAEYSHSDHGHK